MNDEFAFIRDPDPEYLPTAKRSRPRGAYPPPFVIVLGGLALMFLMAVGCAGLLMSRMPVRPAVQQNPAPAPVAESPKPAVSPAKSKRTPNVGDKVTTVSVLYSMGVSFSEDSGALEKYVEFIRLNQEAAARGMIRRGEVEIISAGTNATVRGSWGFNNLCKVDILSGPHAGKTGWIHKYECGYD